MAPFHYWRQINDTFRLGLHLPKTLILPSVTNQKRYAMLGKADDTRSRRRAMLIRCSWEVDRGRYKLLLPLHITRESELPGTDQPSFIRLSTFLYIQKYANVRNSWFPQQRNWSHPAFDSMVPGPLCNSEEGRSVKLTTDSVHSRDARPRLGNSGALCSCM